MRKSPSRPDPSASPGEIGELRRPAEAWTFADLVDEVGRRPGPEHDDRDDDQGGAAERDPAMVRERASLTPPRSIGRRSAHQLQREPERHGAREPDSPGRL